MTETDELSVRLKAFARDCVIHGDMTPGAEQQLHHILDNTGLRRRRDDEWHDA